MPREYNNRVYHLTGRTTAKQREESLAYYYDNRERILAEAKQKRKERKQRGKSESIIKRISTFFPHYTTPPLTDQQVTRALQLKTSGMSYKKIASSLHTTLTRIYSDWNQWKEGDDPEYFKKFTKKHRQEHPEHLKKYQKACLAKRSASGARRRALKEDATVGNLDEIEAIYRQAKEDSGLYCYICGDSIPIGEGRVDHIFPLSKGGKHTPSNLAVTHARCNLDKRDTPPNEMEIHDRSVVERAREERQSVQGVT